MIPRYDQLDLRDPDQVLLVLRTASDANLTASCRSGAIDRVSAPHHPTAIGNSRLIATGDLHDNPVHLARLVQAAGLHRGEDSSPPSDVPPPPAHLTLHEVIHGGRFVSDMDFSYRALVRVAALKAAHPEYVHTLLANHELSQIVGAGIVKDGINVVTAFNDAVDFVFGGRAQTIHDAIAAFIRSMPLALVCESARSSEPAATPERSPASIMCAHSLPSPQLMDRFDPGVLFRDLVEDDYIPRRGSAHLMVWGREHPPEQLTELADRWGVSLFILGHEKADQGALLVPPNAVILNSDHEQGKMIELDFSKPLNAQQAFALAQPIA
ncbi:MAG: hypothetical protein H7210_01875 [Pyrinomonadaceae bacterium]|nr:hypothetical protein [Phycisphaerales bacterium]